jgi:hypothetical protein
MGIADFVRHRYPIDGLSIDDLTDALAVLAHSHDIGAPRILRTEAVWAVVEVGRWKS